MSVTAFRGLGRPQYGPARDSNAVAPQATPTGGIDHVEPAAVGVDLGSEYLRIWASGRPMIDVPATAVTDGPDARLVRRGRIVDESGVAALLRRLQARYTRPVPAGALLVVCRPVLTTANQERLVRDVLNDVFEPSHLLFIDGVRAAAIGSVDALTASTRQALADTTEALQRMNDGTYGVCQHCGDEIPIDRLEVLPSARYCMDCQRVRRG